jgi:hypothetical protein
MDEVHFLGSHTPSDFFCMFYLRSYSVKQNLTDRRTGPEPRPNLRLRLLFRRLSLLQKLEMRQG